ncbi:hypothetical protein STEG23_029493, partial [Scotinomys teguina]
PDTINMPKNTKTKSKNDSSESENEVQKPEPAPSTSQEDQTSSESPSPVLSLNTGFRAFIVSHHVVLSTEDIDNTATEVSKLSIAHEIIVNEDFEVQENDLPGNSVESKFVETMYNAFWDHLKDQLSSNPPDFSCALELINKIKEILVSLLLPRQNHLKNEIEEVLDVELLKQETEHGALDVPHLSNYILNLMALMCSPVRDEAVQKLESIKDPVELLRGIFSVLRLMKMDMVNYTIKSIRPYLQEHSILYERAKFQELLDKQPNLLDCTTKWMTRAATDISKPLPSISVSSGTISSFPSPKTDPEPPSLTTVLFQGYLNLVLRDHGNEEFPEKFLFKELFIFYVDECFTFMYAMDTISDPSCNKTKDPDRALGSGPGLDISMVSGGSTSHPDQKGPGCSMVFRHQHGLRWLTRSQPSIWLLVGTGAPDINPDHDCCRHKDSDNAFGSSPGLGNTMVLGANTGHSDQDVSGDSMALRHSHIHRLWPRPQASMWSLVVTWTTDIKTDPDMFLGSSLGPDSIVVPGGSAGYLDQHGPRDSMALGHKQDPDHRTLHSP